MKVLIVTESSVRSRYWEAALPRLASAGIDVSLASIHEAGELHQELTREGMTAVGLRGKTSRDYPAVVAKLSRLMRQNNTDIVHASEAISATLAGFAKKLAPGTKCIFHYHHTQVSGAQKLFSRLGSKMSDMVMAVSEASRQATIENDGTPGGKTCVAYNGIEPLRSVEEGEISELRRRLEIPANARVVTIVARLREVKGHRTLFAACNMAALNMEAPLHLLVVGDGAEREHLESEGERLSTFKTHFVGHQDDVALWFAAADVVAMPSYFEPFGLVAVEAMDLGKVLIASDVEGPAEIIENGTNGILVPPRDPEALADAMLALFADAAAAIRIGNNARRRVREKFSMQGMVESWIECYKTVLAR